MITPNQPISCVPSTATNNAPANAATNLSYYTPSASVTKDNITGFVRITFAGSGARFCAVNYNVNPATTCKNAILRIEISNFTKTGGDVLYIYGYNGIEIDDNGIYQIPISTATFNFELAGSTTLQFTIKSVQVFCVSESEDCDNCKTGDYQQPILTEFNGSGWTSESLSFQAPALMFKNLLYSICDGNPEWTLTSGWGSIDTTPVCGVDLNYCYPSAGTYNGFVNGLFSSPLINGKRYRISYTLEEIGGEFCGFVNTLAVLNPAAASFTDDAICPGDYVHYFTYTGTSYLTGTNLNFSIRTNANGKVKMRISNVRVDELGGYTATLLPSDLIWSNPAFDSFYKSIKTQVDSESFYGDTFFCTFHFVSNNPNAGFNKDDCFRIIITQDTYDGGSDWYCLSEEYKWITDPCNTIRVLASQNVTDTKGACAFGFNYPSSTALPAGFFHRTRIYGELRNPQYDGEVVSYQDSAGRKRVVYAESREFVELVVNLSPRYVHNFMRLACRHDIFNMNDLILPAADYFTRSEAYSPTWVRTRLVAPAFLEVEVKEQNLRKDPCCDGLPVNPEDCETTCEPCLRNDL